MSRRRTGAVLLATAALAVAGCQADAEDDPAPAPEADGTATTDDGESDPGAFPEGSTMARLAEEGSITIGTKFDQPLFGLVGPDGVPEGFDVEIGTLIAGELGIAAEDIEWVETPSQNRETAIENGDVDLVVATYTINDDRKQRVGFAGPYYEAGQSILTLASNEDIQGPDDLAGARVCTVSGSTPEQNLLENYPEVEVVPFGTYSECLEPLRNGQVDAVSTDNVILAGFAAENDDLEVRGEPFTQEPYGIGVAKDDVEFRMWINDVLEDLFADGRWTQAWESTAGTVLPTPEPPAVDRYED
ncbi:glutamate ABC transporter substrate-binding protein [Actinotalea fermentans]|uniref:Glutamate-binding protein n=1 Tax=Actinotalea fermentans TaxID=43671 RepID=A0A511YVP5_9CELL|nr:glutamate ABC transporter substrate-binding protein [Actinotalea fermentans]KGM16337.1 ABC transporter substrate-binding protein [Actinotalea fermentans ATCC 43279 = JCM 9966 = DSM 3133]GEN79278.1 glutamate-binding protein [Actinotalea fermentans]